MTAQPQHDSKTKLLDALSKWSAPRAMLPLRWRSGASKEGTFTDRRGRKLGAEPCSTGGTWQNRTSGIESDKRTLLKMGRQKTIGR